MDCDKACLEGIAAQYRTAYLAHDRTRAPFADHVRYTENNIEMPFPDGTWDTVTEDVGPALVLSDPVTGQVVQVPLGPDSAPHGVIQGPDGMAWITVRDNGIGITPEGMDKLFQPFARLNLRREFEGSGLGLAISRQIVEAHDGSVTVSSQPGEGSAFEVRLPLA